MATMALMAHEAFDLNELLMSCVNSINCMGLFINHATDPELRGIIHKHMAAHIQDYNMKVEWANKQSCVQKLEVPPMPAKTVDGQNKTPSAVVPNPSATSLDDRAIATSYLLTLKRAGRDYAWSAMEATDPQLRTFLEDAFLMCCRHAYEVWQWLAKKGYYPIEQASATYLQKLSQTYQPVQQMAVVGAH
jgi:spore coat protein CotF